jgi:hypothetical protein
MYCKGVVPDDCKEKKKIFVFSAARFIVFEWLMTRNYPDIITYVFCKKRVVTDRGAIMCDGSWYDLCDRSWYDLSVIDRGAI